MHVINWPEACVTIVMVVIMGWVVVKLFSRE